MCRKCKLLYYIHDADAHEILGYLKHMQRLYIVLIAVSLVGVVLTRHDPRLFLWKIMGLLLYSMNLLSIRWLIQRASVPSTWPCLGTTMLLTVFNLASFLHTLSITHNLWALFELISIVIQASTIYIVYVLRLRLIEAGKWDLDDVKDDVFVDDEIEPYSSATAPLRPSSEP